MECVQHIVCRSCYSQLGKEQDVLMCGGCKLWQHRKCVPDVLPSFYAQFYVSVLQEQKPKHWLCNYCSRYAVREPNELGIKSEKGYACTTLVPRANSPIPMDISDSESELHMSFENNRIEREGLAQSPASPLSSLEDQVIPEVEIIISPRPVVFDHSPLPTTYALHKKSDGQKVVKDCHGNEFKHAMRMNPYVTIYNCVREGCGFKVRTYEDKERFLSGGEFSEKRHNHDIVAKKFVRKPASSSSSDSTSSSESDTRLQKNPTSKLRKSSAKFQLSSSSSSSDDSSDDMNTAINHGRPASNMNTVINHGRPASSDIVNTCSTDSSDSSDESTKPIPDRPVSRNLARKGNGEPESTKPIPDRPVSRNLARKGNEEQESTKPIPDRPVSRNLARKGKEEPESTKPIPDRPVSRNLARKGNEEPESTKPIPDRQVSRNLARKGNEEPESNKPIPDRPVSRNLARKGNKEPESTKPIPDRQVSRNLARKGNEEPESNKPIPDRPVSRNLARKGNEEPESTKPIPDRPVSRNLARKGNEEPESTKPIPDRTVSRNLARKGNEEPESTKPISDRPVSSNREPENASISYTLTDGLASGNQARLTDSQGYCYQIKYKLGARVYWTCTEKVGRCSATVIQQRQDKFIRGVATHNHEPGKSRNTLTSTSANEELPLKSATQPNVKSAATVKPTQQNDVSAPTVKPTQQNAMPAANIKPTQQNVKSAATVKPHQQNVKSAATTHQNVKSAAMVKTAQQNNTSATQQNIKLAVTAVNATQQKVNPTATVKPTQQNDVSAPTVKTTQQKVNPASTQNNKNVTTPVSEETRTPLATTDVLYQEISTCTMYAKRPQSILTSSDGYIYRTKNQWTSDDLTEWRCTHKGPNGKCKGQVEFDHFTWTFRYDNSDPFVWTEDQKNARVIKPHNHQPDMEAAVMIKMKAMIHRQVFGYSRTNCPGWIVYCLAKKSMCDWEKTAL